MLVRGVYRIWITCIAKFTSAIRDARHLNFDDSITSIYESISCMGSLESQVVCSGFQKTYMGIHLRLMETIQTLLESHLDDRGLLDCVLQVEECCRGFLALRNGFIDMDAESRVCLLGDAVVCLGIRECAVMRMQSNYHPKDFNGLMKWVSENMEVGFFDEVFAGIKGMKMCVQSFRDVITGVYGMIGRIPTYFFRVTPRGTVDVRVAPESTPTSTCVFKQGCLNIVEFTINFCGARKFSAEIVMISLKIGDAEIGVVAIPVITTQTEFRGTIQLPIQAKDTYSKCTVSTTLIDADGGEFVGSPDFLYEYRVD